MCWLHRWYTLCDYLAVGFCREGTRRSDRVWRFGVRVTNFYRVVSVGRFFVQLSGSLR